MKYNYKVLRSQFRSRLTTQDRLTGGNNKVFYPIRLIRNIFSKREEDKQFIAEWFNRSIDNIDVLTDEGKFKVKDIKTLKIEIKNRRASVNVKDDNFTTLLTRTADNKTVPMNVKKLRNISIDHTPSIHSILTDKAEQLQGLSKLTDIIKNYINKKKIEKPERKASPIST